LPSVLIKSEKTHHVVANDEVAVVAYLERQNSSDSPNCNCGDFSLAANNIWATCQLGSDRRRRMPDKPGLIPQFMRFVCLKYLVARHHQNPLRDDFLFFSVVTDGVDVLFIHRCRYQQFALKPPCKPNRLFTV
jgi:hypothetical protein